MPPQSHAPSDAWPLPQAEGLESLVAACTAAPDAVELAQRYGFENAFALRDHIAACMDPQSQTARFERVAEAIVAGAEDVVCAELRGDPGLIALRSTRIHRATLLHYVSANGVEDFRQRTPANILEIGAHLLNAGAEVDAPDAMGFGTALGLVASSIHPFERGLQNELLDLLLDGGASVDGHPAGWRPILAALRNGRGEAALHLANRGASLDLESAAGVGRLDVVQRYFAPDRQSVASSESKQCIAGLHAACQYGRQAVVEFLLTQNVDLAAGAGTSQTALHWAVLGGHVDIIALLLRHDARLDLRNVYGGTPLGLARWCQQYGKNGVDYAYIAELLIAAGASS